MIKNTKTKNVTIDSNTDVRLIDNVVTIDINTDRRQAKKNLKRDYRVQSIYFSTDMRLKDNDVTTDSSQ